MIELILIAAGSFVVALVGVWLYRRITELKGRSVSLAGRSGKSSSLRISRQQGYAHIRRPSRGRGHSQIGLATRNPSAKPWGW